MRRRPDPTESDILGCGHENSLVKKPGGTRNNYAASVALDEIFTLADADLATLDEVFTPVDESFVQARNRPTPRVTRPADGRRRLRGA